VAIERLLDQRNLGLDVVVPHRGVPINVEAAGTGHCCGSGVFRLPQRASTRAGNNSHGRAGPSASGAGREDQKRSRKRT
jgi:hypothetical protein